jgi:asparagine synthase (glutamine-hydrolysing)
VDVLDPVDPRFALVLQKSAYTTDGEIVIADELLARLGGDVPGTLRSLLPPFAACFRDRRGGPVTIATDTCGLRHVYHWQGDGWAALSSSSLLLALVVEAGVDEQAMGMFSAIGNHMLEHTPFEGVRRLPAGTMARSSHGRIELETYARQQALAPVAGDRRHQAEVGVGVIREAVGACLRAFPDAGMELSGGFDSRAVLAAIPPDERRGRYALTLGTPGNPDIRVATGIADDLGLDHQIIDITRISEVGPEKILDLARNAALRRDCTANPMGTGVLDWIESQVPRVPRLNGQNAEFGRAHLYPGQRQHDHVTGQMVDRLARWRIIQNHSTDDLVLSAEFNGMRTEEALASLREQFRLLDVDWLRSLDEYYFQSRMERWAGIDYTAAGHDRVILSPYFSAGYLEWVRGCDPHDRRASRVFAAMFDRLDPDLAARPLHLGISPHDVARGGPAVAAKRTWIGTAQTTAKVWQRLRGVGRGSAGADHFAHLVVDAWREVGDPIDALARHRFVDLDGVRRVVDGEATVSSASIAFLVDLEVLGQVTDEFERLLAAAEIRERAG